MTNLPYAMARDEQSLRRLAVRCGLVLLTVLLLVNFVRLTSYFSFVLAYPYGIDYGEGIVWQQMRNILSGEAYGALGVFPAIVYHYPPVYHLTTAAVSAASGIDQLLAGRLVSLLSTLATMLCTGLLAAMAVSKDDGRFAAMGAALVAGLCLASTDEIVKWSALMRVDMLACAFSLAGLLFAARALNRPVMLVLAAAAFLLAVYTKQTSIAAPIAAFIGLWMARPRSAFLLLALCVGPGLLALGLASFLTDGGFLRHVVLYNINRVDLSIWRPLLGRLLADASLIAVAIFAACASWKSLRSESEVAWRASLANDPTRLVRAILLIFLAVKTLMLPLILKSGADTNYLIEWICSVAIFVGIGVVPILRIAAGPDHAVSPILVAFVLICLPITAYNVSIPIPDVAVARHQASEISGIVARIRASQKPVISDDMTLLIRAGCPVLWEPAITAELAHFNLYDEQAFAQMVRHNDFGFFVTQSERGDRLYDSRYNPVVADAIDAAYPRKEHVGGMTLHLPAE
jgi:hypothetical protein